MGKLTRILNNFWFCLGMAVFSLFALWSAALEGSAIWIAVDVFCVLYWVIRAYRTTKLGDRTPLTDEQMQQIKVITTRFSREVDAILKEAADESDNGKDKETDKKKPSDE